LSGAEGGFTLLHRKLLAVEALNTPDTSPVEGKHKLRWVQVKTGRGATEVLLEPGRFIFGSREAADVLGPATEIRVSQPEETGKAREYCNPKPDPLYARNHLQLGETPTDEGTRIMRRIAGHTCMPCGATGWCYLTSISFLVLLNAPARIR